jgi:HAD superfamily hydrolase (TIGR01509 family)
MATTTAVLCDVDDLLAATESLHCRSYCETLAEVGIPLTEAEYADHWVRQGLTIIDFCRLRELAHAPESLRRRKSERYHDLLTTDLRPMPGAVEMLARLRGRYKLAAASSGLREWVIASLQGLGVIDHFDTIVTGSDVARLKPDPEIFLTAAAQLHVPPAECVVLEDAEKGVRAARAAGMKVIAVPSHMTRDNDFSTATRTVNSLWEVTPPLIDSL